MTSDSLLKYLAVVFLFMVMLGALIIAGYQIMMGITPNAFAISILGTGLGYAMTAAGVIHGSNIVAAITQSTPSVPPVATETSKTITEQTIVKP